MAQTTYGKILKSLYKKERVKRSEIIKAFDTWRTNGGSDNIENIEWDYYVLEEPLAEIIEHLIIFKSVTAWNLVKPEFISACDTIINKFTNGGSYLASEDYSQYLADHYNRLEVGRCISLTGFLNRVAKRNRLGIDAIDDYQQRLEMGRLTYDEKNVWKHKISKDFSPIWVTFAYAHEKPSRPFSFARGSYQHLQLRSCLGLTPDADDEEQLVVTYFLKPGEKLRFPTVIDAEDYDFFRSANRNKPKNHGLTKFSANSGEIFNRLSRTESFKRNFAFELRKIESVKLDPSLTDLEKSNITKEIKSKIKKRINNTKFQRCRPEAVYFSEREFKISDFESYKITKP